VFYPVLIRAKGNFSQQTWVRPESRHAQPLSAILVARLRRCGRHSERLIKMAARHLHTRACLKDPDVHGGSASTVTTSWVDASAVVGRR
jgi:hypothetical protein